jgi:methylaspartate ammonia-lyase
LNRKFDAGHHEELQGKIRGVLIDVAHLLTDSQAGLIDEFIDANELGLALEDLSEALFDAGAKLSPGVVDRIAGLSHEMGLEAEVANRLEVLTT